MNLTNKVFVVTGASRGLGKILLEMLSGLGAIVIGTYYRTKVTSNYKMIKCNIANEKDVINLYNYVLKNYMRIDGVINCAALCEDEDFTKKTFTSFMKVIKTNVGGTFLINKYASLNMKKGSIINVSSTDASDTYSTYSMDYAASKAAVENLTKNFAQRMPNLKVCAIAPSWMDTQTILDMDPKYLESEMNKHGQKRLLKKEKVALKIIDMITKDDYKSGDIVRMETGDE